jgi:hypothetical protein
MSFRSSPLPLRLNVESLERRETPATLYGLTIDNRIARFDSATPGNVEGNVPIQELIVSAGNSGSERVVGIDVRPRTGQLYGLAVRTSTPVIGLPVTTGRLLLINPLTGAASQVGSDFVVPLATLTDAYGFDFNPTVDRIRVVNRSGVNLRLDPNTGGSTADAPILAGGPVDAAAYDRNFDGKLGANGTTLFTINPTTGNLHTQGTVNQVVSPNSGLQNVVGPLGTPIDAAGGVGFDVTGGTAFALFDGIPGAAVGTGLYTVNLTTGAATLAGLVGDGTGSFVGLAAAAESRFAVGSGAGTDARVEVYDAGGTRLREFNPYPGFRGGVTVAMADVTRDGVLDVITGASSGGGPHVKVFDGVTFAEVRSFYAYAPNFGGGVNVAAGDVNGDGYADIITGAGPGGAPHVRAFSGLDTGELATFYAYSEAFPGGVRVAAGDFDNNGLDEIVTAAGPGGGPHVRTWGRDLAVFGNVSPFLGTGGAISSFYAYAPTFGAGVWVGVGDLNGDGTADILTGADTGGGPHVRGFSGRDGSEIASFYGFDESFSGGVRVGVADTDRDGRAEALVAPASNRGNQVLRAFDPNTATRLRTFDVVDGASSVFVGGAIG